MKIIKLTAENVKRLRAVCITPDDKPLVVIGGKNGQGKSSTLDSIEYGLAGGKNICERPLRDGASKGRVVIETDELTVTRTFTPKGSQLIVTGKDGVPCGSPQQLLDKLTGNLSFDPLAFSRMKALDQAATLRQVVGLDFSKLDLERQQCYDERRDVNRLVKDLDAQIDAIPIESVPSAEVSSAELMAELKKRQERNKGNEDKRRAQAQNRESLKRAVADVESIKRQIQQLTEMLAGLESKADMLQQAVADGDKALAELKDADEAEVSAQILAADSINSAIRRQRERARKVAERDQLGAKSQELSDRMEEIEAEKKKALAEAKFPIPDLLFSDEGITFKGIPFDQCCDSEKLKISVAMGLAMNPDIKVLLVRDGSLLDDDSLKMVAEMAAAAEAQVWIERVSTGDEVQVIIEDGQVKAEEGSEQ